MVGANNAMVAYSLYAGRVPPLAMQCLVYMALVSLDADERPWYGQGHKALAEHALGRPAPITKADLEADRKAVQRAVGPLLAKSIKAIEVDRRPAGRRDGPHTTRYRLNLDAGRKPSCVDGAGPRTGRSERGTETGRNGGRKPGERWTESVPALDGNRPPEEEEEEEERGEEEGVASPAQVQTAREDNEPTEEIDLAEEKPSGDRPVCGRRGAYLDPDGSCFACKPRNHPLPSQSDP